MAVTKHPQHSQRCHRSIREKVTAAPCVVAAPSGPANEGKSVGEVGQSGEEQNRAESAEWGGNRGRITMAAESYPPSRT